MKTVFERGGLKVELDRDQVFLDDPGAGTPAMVYWRKGDQEFSASYWCASETGELDGGSELGSKWLTKAQVAWLHGLEEKIDEFLYGDFFVGGEPVEHQQVPSDFLSVMIDIPSGSGKL